MKPPHLSLVTEYMEMGSLYYLIHTSGQKKRLSWRKRLKMLRDICRQVSILPYRTFPPRLVHVVSLIFVFRFELYTLQCLMGKGQDYNTLTNALKDCII